MKNPFSKNKQKSISTKEPTSCVENTRRHTIDKHFTFDYGHRVHNQVLNSDYSVDSTCACRHLHGHTGTVRVYLSTKHVTNGFVTDFKHLNWLKQFIDDYIDHKFIIDINDPWFVNITNMSWFNDPDDGSLLGWAPKMPLNTTNTSVIQANRIYFPHTDMFAGYTIDTQSLSGVEEEFYGSFFVVNFVPTSENLAEWLAKGTDQAMQPLGVSVDRVDWMETPTSRASYINHINT